MEGLSQAIPTKVTVRIIGRDFIIDPLLLEDFASVEVELAVSKPDIIRDAIEATRDAPDNLKEFAIATAIDRKQKARSKVTEAEALEFIFSNQGLAFVLFRSLRRNGYNLDRDTLFRWILTCKDEAKAVLDRFFAASGLGGNEQRPATMSNQVPAGQSTAASTASPQSPSEPTGSSSSSGCAQPQSTAAAASRRSRQRGSQSQQPSCT